MLINSIDFAKIIIERLKDFSMARIEVIPDVE